MIRFSVIMPLYNKEKHIINAIESVLNQTYHEFELIVVNDGSTDNSLSIVKNYIRAIKRIKVINQINSGVSAARNRGAAESQNEYLAFLDADDLWHPFYLETMREAITQYPEYLWFGVNFKKFTGELQYPTIEELSFQPMDYFEGSIKIKNQYSIIHPNSFIVSKKLFMDVGGYPEGIRHSEDYDLFFRLAKKTTIIWANLPLTFWRLDAENRAVESTSIRQMDPFIQQNISICSQPVRKSDGTYWEREFIFVRLILWISFTIGSAHKFPGSRSLLLYYTFLCRKTGTAKKYLLTKLFPAALLYTISPFIAGKFLTFHPRAILRNILNKR